jgi:hypothetical protein
LTIKYNLPSFIKIYSLPNEYHIIAKANIFYIKEENYKPFDSFKEALTYIYDELKGEAKFDAEEIAGNCANAKNSGHGMLSIWNGTHYEMFISKDKANGLKMLEETYEYFLNVIAKNYQEKPKDFVNSWHFINNHPMFWSQQPPFIEYWNTEMGVDSVEIMLCDDEEHHSKPRILLEHGPYESEIIDDIEYEHVVHTIDYDLTSEAKTFEKAIIKMAAKIMKHYSLDGEKII